VNIRRQIHRADTSTASKESMNMTPLTRRIARRAFSILHPLAARGDDSVTTGQAVGKRSLRTSALSLAAAGVVAVGAAALLLAAPAAANPSSHPFAVEPGTFHIVPSTTQAGAHSDLTTTFNFEHEANEEENTYNDVRNTVVNLPPGFTGNESAVPTCTDAQLAGEGNFARCPVDSQVGQISFDLTVFLETPLLVTAPVYNMESNAGVAATLGFHAVLITQTLPVTVRPGDSGLTVTSPNLPALGEIHNVTFTVWGIPAAESHTEQRGRYCVSGAINICLNEGGEPDNIPVKPFLSNPTSCTEAPFRTTMTANSWEEPESFSEESTEIAPMTGCERLAFNPSLEVQPTTDAAESPSGLNASLVIPQTYEDPETLATGHLKKAVVTLPEGFSLNPSSGSGLGVCTPQQYAAETASSLPGEGCPLEAKVGTVEVETPVLSEKASGSVYVAEPFDNPFDSLLALYIVAKIPDRGIIVKTAGKIEPNPVTGQLTTTFDETPQVPFNKFTLKFRQGATSPLVTAPACGEYTAEADLTPWSAPLEPRHLSNSFEIEHGVGGGPCPSAGIPPFHPGLVAGTLNNRAGSYSPFYVRLSRQDGEQEITHFSIKLPPGVIGKLAGIPLCSNAAITAAKEREHTGGGAEEQASPSCPAASEVGHALVEAGVGPVLAQAPGKIYLAGPYHGSAISVAAITAAKVGPFDLGTVVVREGLKVNPETGEVFVDSTGSDPLPHIVDGIPTHLRNIRIYMDRPEFVLNPTSCEPTSTASTVLGSGLDFASEADDQPLVVSSLFQAADCAALPFKPKLTLKLKGSTKRGGNPALHAHLAMHGIGEAGLAYAQTSLPPTEFLDNAHIGTVCTRVQFKEGAQEGEKCPPGSLIGHAKAVTPLLSEPLEGPIYLRSNPERELPDIAAALHGQEINVVAVGHTESAESGGLRNTFEVVPDAPITSVDIDLFGGHRGLLENAPPGNANSICQAKTYATLKLKGHNGKQANSKVPLQATGCKKHKKSKRYHHRAGG
jgi:hypothetical protein